VPCVGPQYGGELEYLRTFIRPITEEARRDPAEPLYLLTDSHIGYRFARRSQNPSQKNVELGPIRTNSPCVWLWYATPSAGLILPNRRGTHEPLVTHECWLIA